MFQNGAPSVHRKKKEKHVHRHVPTEYHFVMVYDTPELCDVVVNMEDAHTSHNGHEKSNKPRNQDSNHAHFRDILKHIFSSFIAIIPRRFTYYRIHLLFFATTVLVVAGIIYPVEQCTNLAFIDALYLSASAMTVTGLASHNVVDLCWATQFILFLEMIVGGIVLMTIPLVVVRRHFYRKFVRSELKKAEHFKVPLNNGIGVLVKPKRMTVSQFLEDNVSLEYDALRKIIQVVVSYFVFCNLVGFLMVYFYTLAYPSVNENTSASTWWLAMFHTISAFNNVGLSLFPDSFVRYRNDKYLLIVFSILILAGNVCFPIFLRIIIYFLDKVKHKTRKTKHISHKKDFAASLETASAHPSHPTSRFRHHYQVYDFLLTFPRQCYTHLFPSYETKFLVIVIIFLFLLQLILSIILGWNSSAFQGNSDGTKFLMSLFQTISIRSSGLTVMDLSVGPPSLWVVQLVMMYISYYPVTVTLRESTIVQEEVFPMHETLVKRKKVDRTNPVRHIAQSLLFRDVFWLFLAWFCVATAEKSKLTNDPANFSMFKIIYEIVSAYGTVGFSLGFPGSVLSFSAGWTAFSKVVLVMVMLLGRQRGLPEDVDRAVQLPHNFLQLTSSHQIASKGTEVHEPIPVQGISNNRTLSGF